MTRTGERHIVGRTVARLDELFDADAGVVIADHVVATFRAVEHHSSVRLTERQYAIL